MTALSDKFYIRPQMEISWFNVMILLIAGFAGGFVNAVSAAGSLITLPAFIFAGLSPAQANATNRIAILIQNFSSVSAYRTKGIKTEPYMWWAALAAIPGAIAGAWFSLKIPDDMFTKILSVVMILFLVITLSNPLKNVTKQNERVSLGYKISGLVLFFLIGIYGGFIQAGTGFFIMAAGLLHHRFDLIKTNLYKALVMFTYTIAAVLMFMWKGDILWLQGIILALGMGAGAFSGVRWSMVVSEIWLKRVIVVIVSAMAIYLWFLK
jgi:hypothetical protein